MNQLVDPPCLLCIYTQVFMLEHHCEWKRNPGAHQNVMSPAGPLLLCTVKGGGPRLGGERVAIGQVGDSFWRQIDREAVARTSGRHWTNLIN